MASEAAPGVIDVGKVLADTYEITRLLGEGGMGAVWEAKHLRLRGKKVAIKVLHSIVAKDTEAVVRFEREAQIASQLGHPNIIQVHDFNALPDGTPYLVLEFLAGESLAERMQQGPLPLQYALAVARQIGSALQAAHNADVVHRDLKPHNVFLSPTESGGYATELVKVLDFGISKIHGSTTVKTQTHAILGTPQYMSPEQARGAHDEVDGRTDQFALGTIVYEMLTGRAAFAGDSIPAVMFKVVYEEPPPLAQLMPMVPMAVVNAIQRAMAKDRDQRFGSVSAFIEALTGDPLITLRGGPATAAMPSPPLSPSLAHEVALRSAAGRVDPTAATMAPNEADLATAATMAPASTGHSPWPPDALVAAANALPTPGTRPPAAQTPPATGGAASTSPAAVAAAAAAGPPAHGIADTSPDVNRPASATRHARVPIYAGLGVVLLAGAVGAVIALGAGGGAETSAAATIDAAPVAVASNDEPNGHNADQNADQASDQNGDQRADQAPADAGTARADNDDGNARNDGDDGDDGDTRAGDGDRRNRPAAGDDVPSGLRRELETLSASDPDKALRRARNELWQSQPQLARYIMTLASCRKGDLGGARSYSQGLRGRLLTRAKRVCTRQQIDLR
ncbi:protein kinase domain-containing protein [Haliangium sp.]|uniref:serine/threonine-protein kinase n=1 Tax=Haliangium sp. TaxID=2663208 RepID=UPI003D10892F